ncbi:MAG: hypothetical protein JWM46_150 [Candidatus Kaiserbacteria bacterium]|nr:hypothetical protein [Candidatus Kaiserbacteria bacterium]
MYRGRTAAVILLIAIGVFGVSAHAVVAATSPSISDQANKQCEKDEAEKPLVWNKCEYPAKFAGSTCGYKKPCSGKIATGGIPLQAYGHCVKVLDCQADSYIDEDGVKKNVAPPTGVASGTSGGTAQTAITPTSASTFNSQSQLTSDDLSHQQQSNNTVNSAFNPNAIDTSAFKPLPDQNWEQWLKDYSAQSPETQIIKTSGTDWTGDTGAVSSDLKPDAAPSGDSKQDVTDTNTIKSGVTGFETKQTPSLETIAKETAPDPSEQTWREACTTSFSACGTKVMDKLFGGPEGSSESGVLSPNSSVDAKEPVLTVEKSEVASGINESTSIMCGSQAWCDKDSASRAMGSVLYQESSWNTDGTCKSATAYCGLAQLNTTEMYVTRDQINEFMTKYDGELSIQEKAKLQDTVDKVDAWQADQKLPPSQRTVDDPRYDPEAGTALGVARNVLPQTDHGGINPMQIAQEKAPGDPFAQATRVMATGQLFPALANAPEGKLIGDPITALANDSNGYRLPDRATVGTLLSQTSQIYATNFNTGATLMDQASVGTNTPSPYLLASNSTDLPRITEDYIPLPQANPLRNSPDVNFGGLSTLQAVEFGETLADITPLENRIPAPEWNAYQYTADAGRDITADVAQNTSQVITDEVAQRNDRLAQADAEAAQTAADQAAQHADRLARADLDAAQLAREAQIAQDQSALLQQNDATAAQLERTAQDQKLVEATAQENRILQESQLAQNSFDHPLYGPRTAADVQDAFTNAQAIHLVESGALGTEQFGPQTAQDVQTAYDAQLAADQSALVQTNNETETQLAAEAQAQADQNKVLADRQAQADAETKAYEARLANTEKNIPVPDTTQQSGEDITAQIKGETDSKLAVDQAALITKNNEAESLSAKTSAETFVPKTESLDKLSNSMSGELTAKQTAIQKQIDDFATANPGLVQDCSESLSGGGTACAKYRQFQSQIAIAQEEQKTIANNYTSLLEYKNGKGELTPDLQNTLQAIEKGQGSYSSAFQSSAADRLAAAKEPFSAIAQSYRDGDYVGVGLNTGLAIVTSPKIIGDYVAGGLITDSNKVMERVEYVTGLDMGFNPGEKDLSRCATVGQGVCNGEAIGSAVNVAGTLWVAKDATQLGFTLAKDGFIAAREGLTIAGVDSASGVNTATTQFDRVVAAQADSQAALDRAIARGNQNDIAVAQQDLAVRTAAVERLQGSASNAGTVSDVVAAETIVAEDISAAGGAGRTSQTNNSGGAASDTVKPGTSVAKSEAESVFQTPTVPRTEPGVLEVRGTGTNGLPDAYFDGTRLQVRISKPEIPAVVDDAAGTAAADTLPPKTSVPSVVQSEEVVSSPRTSVPSVAQAEELATGGSSAPSVTPTSDIAPAPRTSVPEVVQTQEYVPSQSWYSQVSDTVANGYSSARNWVSDLFTPTAEIPRVNTSIAQNEFTPTQTFRSSPIASNENFVSQAAPHGVSEPAVFRNAPSEILNQSPVSSLVPAQDIQPTLAPHPSTVSADLTATSRPAVPGQVSVPSIPKAADVAPVETQPVVPQPKGLASTIWDNTLGKVFGRTDGATIADAAKVPVQSIDNGASVLAEQARTALTESGTLPLPKLVTEPTPLPRIEIAEGTHPTLTVSSDIPPAKVVDVLINDSYKGASILTPTDAAQTALNKSINISGDKVHVYMTPEDALALAKDPNAQVTIYPIARTPFASEVKVASADSIQNIVTAEIQKPGFIENIKQKITDIVDSFRGTETLAPARIEPTFGEAPAVSGAKAPEISGQTRDIAITDNAPAAGVSDPAAVKPVTPADAATPNPASALQQAVEATAPTNTSWTDRIKNLFGYGKSETAARATAETFDYGAAPVGTQPTVRVTSTLPENPVLVEISNTQGAKVVVNAADADAVAAARSSDRTLRGYVSQADADALAAMKNGSQGIPEKITIAPESAATKASADVRGSSGSTAGSTGGSSGPATVHPSGTSGGGGGGGSGPVFTAARAAPDPAAAATGNPVWNATKSVAGFCVSGVWRFGGCVAAGAIIYNAPEWIGSWVAGNSASAPSGGAAVDPQNPATGVAVPPAKTADAKAPVDPAAKTATPVAPPYQAPQVRISAAPPATGQILDRDFACIKNINPVLVVRVPAGSPVPTGCYNNPGNAAGGTPSTLGSALGAIAAKLFGTQPAATTAASSATAPSVTATSTATSTPVTKPIVPSVSFIANPSSVASGDTAKLSWAAVGSTACTIMAPDASVVTTGSFQGSFTTAPLSATTLFSIACTGAGTSSAQVTVTVK